MKIEGAEKGAILIQIFFCLKEKNQLSSLVLQCLRSNTAAFNVCILLDVGITASPTSIYHLSKAFDINSEVGGGCGEIVEIVALKCTCGKYLINALVAPHNFEYTMSNILDKPLKSCSSTSLCCLARLAHNGSFFIAIHSTVPRIPWCANSGSTSKWSINCIVSISTGFP